MITPEQTQQLMIEIIRESVERQDKAVEDAMDKGWLIYTMGKPEDRKQGYVEKTDPQDIENILNGDYWELWHADILPPPISPFWQNLTMLGPKVFKKLQADMRSLWKQEAVT